MDDTMKRVLIGSCAAKHWFPDYREAKDEDYLVEGITRMRDPEYHDCTQGDGLRWIFDNCDKIAPPEILYTLKLSHCFWPIHWQKTMYDIQFFQEHGVKHNEGLFQMLYRDWEKIHGAKPAMLKKENEDFFKDGVDRIYVHDDIHKAIAYGDQPMYESVKKNPESALISREMFEKLPHEDKCKLCREEIYVVALERFLIPHNFQKSTIVAYRGACRLLITSMTKGWFPKFIALNWRELRDPDGHDFVQLFHKRKEAIRCLPNKKSEKP